VIRYRKSHGLQFSRAAAPEPPFWAATTIAPYSFPRSKPLALDYLRLTGTGVEQVEVLIGSEPAERLLEDRLAGPVLIDGTERAEAVYGRASAIHEVIRRRRDDGAVIQLISTDGVVPELQPGVRSVIALAAWPLHLTDLQRLAAELHRAGWRWGLAVPILFSATTDLGVLQELAELAQKQGAEFLTGIRFELDPHARRALAASTSTDDDTYSMLFDEGEEAISLATERHVSALAFELGLPDAALPPDRDERTNWNAAVLTALAGTRLIEMGADAELGWEFIRSARRLATLDKSLTTIAAAASLSIIEGLPPQIIDSLEEWMESGRAQLFDQINARWRLRRDYRR